MKELKKDNTEEKILTAAKNVFIQKGMDGARMQEIANEAGINRYGIDIRTDIDLATDNIATQNNLIFQDQYLEKLTRLKKKYSS